MLRRTVVLFIVLVLIAVAAPHSVQGASVRLVVSVAASLTDAIAEVKPLFEQAYPSVTLQFNFGSSGALQQQIERGAPVDVFVSAAEAPINHLVEKGLIADGSVRHAAYNRLVLIRPMRPSRVLVDAWADLLGERVERVAIGNPEHVPAGVYAQRTLEFLGLWDHLRPKVIMGEDVRQTLQYVRLGAVDAGIVYATDAATVSDVVVVAKAPDGSHPPVVYPVAPIRTSRHPGEAEAFVRFLLADEAQQILSKHGFVPAE